MLLFYIRHGDPIYNPDSLTPLGEAQANALSKRFCTYGLDRVFSSPSNRAMQTAKPTCDLLKREITLCDWAEEGLAMRDFGVPHPVHGRTWCFYDQNLLRLFNSPEVRALGDKCMSIPTWLHMISDGGFNGSTKRWTSFSSPWDTVTTEKTPATKSSITPGSALPFSLIRALVCASSAACWIFPTPFSPPISTLVTAP